MKKKKIIIINLIFTLLLILCHPIFMMNIDASEEAKLTQVVVLSRHNIRAPLSTKGSILDEATPHTWFSWSSEASELSSKGGMLETAMGQYFRKYLESEGLLPSNYQPKDDSIRFYANSMQRTIATANYFRSGFLPVGDIQVETKTEFNTMDPTFHPQFTYLTEEYIKEAEQQMRNLIPDLSEEYALLTDVLDMHDSTAYQNKKIEDFKNDDNTFSFEVNKEPTIKGSLKSATSLADALVLQYYEDPDAKKAAFDHSLTNDDWEKIAHIKDVYGDVLFTAPLVAPHVAHPLLKEIQNELQTPNRIFTFLCGHDSNLSSVLAALKVKDYDLPEAIEKKTPIGSKLVFEKWQKGNEELLKVKLVYDSIDQLRNISTHDLENPPMIYEFSFTGIEKNDDGYYPLSTFLNHLQLAIDEYKTILNQYPQARPIVDTSAK